MNSDFAEVLDQRKNGKKTKRSSANKYVPSRNRRYGAVRKFPATVYRSVWNGTTLKT